MIVSQSGYQKALEESERDIFGNKTFASAYSELDYQTQLAEAQASRTFGEDVAKAYEAATMQRSAIEQSNLTEGYKALLNVDLNESMSQAYQQYLANYESNISTIAESNQKALADIDEQLAERAQYLGEYDKSHYEYLQYIDEWMAENATDKERESFFKNINFGKFYDTEEITDEEGNVTTNYTLKNWEKLSTPVVDPLTGEYLSIYDNEGNLTRVGRNFYKQIENYYGQMATAGGSNIPSYAAYLYEANPELYDYINTTNMYSYTETGTGLNENLGAFRKALGIESDADTYRFLDEFGGLSKSEIDSVFYDMQSKFADIDISEITTEDFDNVLDEFGELASQIGYLPNDQSIDDFKSQARAILTQYQQYAEAHSEAVAGEIGSAVVMFGIVAALSIATAGAATGFIGAGLGLGTQITGTLAAGAANVSIINQAFKSEEYERLMNASEADLKEFFMNTLTAMTASVEEQYEQKLIDSGGKLGQGANLTIGSSYESLDDWAKISDTPLSEAEYQSFYNQTVTRSNKLSANSYYVQGLGSGRENDDIDITIGSSERDTESEFDLQCGSKVTNKRMINYLNKYATGDFNTEPNNATTIVVANKMYIYTKKGWRNVIDDRDSVADAIKAYLKQ